METRGWGGHVSQGRVGGVLKGAGIKQRGLKRNRKPPPCKKPNLGHGQKGEMWGPRPKSRGDKTLTANVLSDFKKKPKKESLSPSITARGGGGGKKVGKQFPLPKPPGQGKTIRISKICISVLGTIATHKKGVADQSGGVEKRLSLKAGKTLGGGVPEGNKKANIGKAPAPHSVGDSEPIT